MTEICPLAVEIKQLPCCGYNLSEQVKLICDFCGKKFSPNTILRRLAGQDAYYCTFCVRHRFHTKEQRHIFLLSFQSIIGYYYTDPHIHQKATVLQINDLISRQITTGLNHPLFFYDYETSIWFVDFARIGDSKRKTRLNTVLNTIYAMLSSLSVSSFIPNMDVERFTRKITDAFIQFQKTRKRPGNKQIFCPTISECFVSS